MYVLYSKMDLRSSLAVWENFPSGRPLCFLWKKSCCWLGSGWAKVDALPCRLSSSKGHMHSSHPPLGDSFSFCHFPLTLFWLDTLFMGCDILYFWIDFVFSYCKAFLWTSTSGWYIFFSFSTFWLTCFSLSFSLFASCFPFPSIVNWQVQHSSSQNKTIIENKKSSAPILMRQLY